MGQKTGERFSSKKKSRNASSVLARRGQQCRIDADASKMR